MTTLRMRPQSACCIKLYIHYFYGEQGCAIDQPWIGHLSGVTSEIATTPPASLETIEGIGPNNAGLQDSLQSGDSIGG